MRSRRLMSIPTIQVLIITGANEVCGLQNSSFASVWTPKFGFQIFLFGFGHSKCFRFSFKKTRFISVYSFTLAMFRGLLKNLLFTAAYADY